MQLFSVSITRLTCSGQRWLRARLWPPPPTPIGRSVGRSRGWRYLNDLPQKTAMDLCVSSCCCCSACRCDNSGSYAMHTAVVFSVINTVGRNLYLWNFCSMPTFAEMNEHECSIDLYAAFYMGLEACNPRKQSKIDSNQCMLRRSWLTSASAVRN